MDFFKRLFHRKKKVLKKNDFDKYIISFNIRTIVFWEKLSGKSFFKFENSEEDVLKLLYCSLVANNDFPIEYDTFLILLEDEEVSKWIMSKYMAISQFNEQFNKNVEENVEEKDEDDEEKEKEDFSITDFAANLIVQFRMDPEYVYEKMQIWEMDTYFHVGEQLRERGMENDRFWTYLTILPHIDSSKLKSPDKLIQFPWEKDRNKKTAEAKMKKDMALINKIFKKKTDTDGR